MLVLTIILAMLVLLARVRETWRAHVGPKKKKELSLDVNVDRA